MENNNNKKSVKFQGDMLNFCDFIQVFVFTRNHHLNIRKQEMISTKAYEETSEEEKIVVVWHCNDVVLKFSVNVKEQQHKLSTIY